MRRKEAFLARIGHVSALSVKAGRFDSIEANTAAEATLDLDPLPAASAIREIAGNSKIAITDESDSPSAPIE